MIGSLTAQIVGDWKRNFGGERMMGLKSQAWWGNYQLGWVNPELNRPKNNQITRANHVCAVLLYRQIQNQRLWSLAEDSTSASIYIFCNFVPSQILSVSVSHFRLVCSQVKTLSFVSFDFYRLGEGLGFPIPIFFNRIFSISILPLIFMNLVVGQPKDFIANQIILMIYKTSLILFSNYVSYFSRLQRKELLPKSSFQGIVSRVFPVQFHMLRICFTLFNLLIN